MIHSPYASSYFKNRNDNIRGWFLANKGHDPLDLMVLEAFREDGVDLEETPEPANGRYRFLTAMSGMSRLKKTL